MSEITAPTPMPPPTPTPTPTVFRFDAERAVMVPANPNYACRVFVDGERYRLGIIEDRSTSSHNHYFAMIAEAWNNLPEAIADRFPTSEHLRKYALIKAGYYNSRSIVAASKDEAERIAAFVAPMDEYAVVMHSDCIVTVYTAKSQSKKSMGAKEFQASKDAVLGVISAMISTPQDVLKQNAGRAA